MRGLGQWRRAQPKSNETCSQEGTRRAGVSTGGEKRIVKSEKGKRRREKQGRRRKERPQREKKEKGDERRREKRRRGRT